MIRAARACVCALPEEALRSSASQGLMGSKRRPKRPTHARTEDVSMLCRVKVMNSTKTETELVSIVNIVSPSHYQITNNVNYRYRNFNRS
jgi:hypothetical protein